MADLSTIIRRTHWIMTKSNVIKKWKNSSCSCTASSSSSRYTTRMKLGFVSEAQTSLKLDFMQRSISFTWVSTCILSARSQFRRGSEARSQVNPISDRMISMEPSRVKEIKDSWRGDKVFGLHAVLSCLKAQRRQYYKLYLQESELFPKSHPQERNDW